MLSIVKSKLAIGVVVAALTAVVGATGVNAVFAHGDHPAPPPSKEACMNGGWEDLGFKNQGECISAFEVHNPPGNGGGYGGSNNNTVNANVNIELNNSNNNIINVIIRLVFGS